MSAALGYLPVDQGPPRNKHAMSAARVLQDPVARTPEHEALVARSGRLTYRELDHLASLSGSALRSLGVKRGDRVAVSLPNDISIVAAFHGAMRIGAIWVGINRKLAPPEKEYILSDCTPSVFLADHQVLAQMQRLTESDKTLRLVSAGVPGSEWEELLSLADIDPFDPPDPLGPAAIAYTSGTTGLPKGAVHSQHNLMLPGAVITSQRSYGPSLRKADCFPLTILNLQVLSTLLAAQAGGTAIVMDRLDPVGIAQWIESERATVFNGAPAMLYSLAANEEVHPDSLRSLNEVWSGGSNCSALIQEMFTSKFGHFVHNTYGLTEAPAAVSIQPLHDYHGGQPNCSGRPLPHLEVEIVDNSGKLAPTGCIGEITLRAKASGPWANSYRPMLSYWNRPKETAETIRQSVLRTGDIGWMDREGYLGVQDRQSSVILRGGANIYPAEVERILDSHPQIAASCVVGVPDERLGERVVAVVQPAEGVTVDTAMLYDLCETNLARYKIPEAFIIGSLPRNSMEKIQRREVARWAAQRMEG